MQFVLDGRLFETREIPPETTIGQLKALLKQYKVGGTIKLTFSDGRTLAPAVFDTNTYDAVNFLQYASVLKGSRLDITSKTINYEDLLKERQREREQNLETVYSIISIDGRRIAIPYSTTNLVSALNYWYDNHVADNVDFVEYLREIGIVRSNNYTEEQLERLKDLAIIGEGFWVTESKLHR